MQSRRKRVASHHEEDASQLLTAYQNCTPVGRHGKHTVLRWLVMSRCYNLLDHEPACLLSKANATSLIMSRDALEELEQETATRVHAKEQHVSYLTFAAYFYRWWDHIVSVAAGPRLPETALPECAWLSDTDAERSLVVPDIRRAAVKLAQRMELRAGESELVAELTGGKKSVSAVCQAMRTGERCNLVHNTIMYGTLTDIYHCRLLDVIYLAIINSRYLGRLNFNFIDHVIVLPCAERLDRQSSWPLIYVHGGSYIVQSGKYHRVCTGARAAYAQWLACCLAQGGVIGGCYDVRKCTI